MIEIALPLVLTAIMFVMGIELRLASFLKVWRRPRDLALGLTLQLVGLPLLAQAVLFVIPLRPETAAGLVLLAACPGGAASNMITYLARGDVPLSISLTASNALIGIVTVPIVLDLAVRLLMGAEAPEVRLLPTMLGLLALTLVPTLLGMALRARAPGLAGQVERVARPVVGVLFLLVVIGAVIEESDDILGYIVEAGPAALLLNLAAMALAWATARHLASGKPQARTLVIEAGVQNAALALTIALTMLDTPALGVPAGIYGLIALVTAGVYAGLSGPRGRARTAGA